MTATPDLEFFYDCSSPWTYFAFTRIIPLTEKLQVPVRWRPILVGGVFNAVNQEVYAARDIPTGEELTSISISLSSNSPFFSFSRNLFRVALDTVLV